MSPWKLAMYGYYGIMHGETYGYYGTMHGATYGYHGNIYGATLTMMLSLIFFHPPVIFSKWFFLHTVRLQNWQTVKSDQEKHTF